MKRKVYAAIGGLAALVIAFIGGRYSAPVTTVETVKVETKVVTVTEWKDRVVEKRVEGPVREVERIVEKPGAERVVTRWIERGPVSVDTTADVSGSSSAQAHAASQASKVTTAGRPGWRAAVTAAWSSGRLSLEPERYTVEVGRRLFGTLWLGVQASTDKAVGVGLGFEW
jgi:hypothetical protein